MNRLQASELVVPAPPTNDLRALFVRSNSELGNLLMELESSASALVSSEDSHGDDAHGVVHGIGRAKKLMAAIDVIQHPSPRLRGMSFGELLTEILEDMASTLPRAVRLHAQVDQRLPWVRGDATLLSVMVRELLTNALTALDGHGLLTLEAVAVQLERQWGDLAPGSYVRLSVEDSGPGLERQMGARVYEPFVSSWPSQLGHGSGHWGLGLAQVRAIAESHEGSVSLYSEPGVGTRAMVLLPACERTEMPERSFRPSLDHLPRLEILLVDDNRQILESVARALSQLGHGVLWAESSEQALQRAQESPRIDAAIVDVHLGLESGEELARRLGDQFPDMRIVLTSGFGDTLVPVEQQPLPMLRKPFSPRDLLRAIQQMEP